MKTILLSEKHPTKFVFLDGLRGFAALYVMVGHARWLLWEGYQSFSSHPDQYSTIDKVFVYFFSFFKWGHEFVLLFFVLSGFVIHNGYSLKLKKDKAARIDLRQYLKRRIRRIYPPFLLAILLTLVFDTLGKWNNFPIYYGSTPYQLINDNIGNSSHDIRTLIGNIFFLYKDYVPVFGTNGPTWSLKFEWWFYLIYPFFLYISRKHIYYSSALILILFVASFFPSFWPGTFAQSIFASMICWWLGVLLAEVSSKRIPVKMQWAIITFSSMAVSLFLFKKNGSIHDLQVAFLFAAIIAFSLWLNKRGIKVKVVEKLKPLGDFSYTLYIIHFPILTFISGFVMKHLNNKLPMHSYFVFAGIAVSLTIAYLLHFIVEVPFLGAKKVHLNNNAFVDPGVKKFESFVNVE